MFTLMQLVMGGGVLLTVGTLYWVTMSSDFSLNEKIILYVFAAVMNYFLVYRPTKKGGEK